MNCVDDPRIQTLPDHFTPVLLADAMTASAVKQTDMVFPDPTAILPESR
jgi:hypothetical protein